jgi:NAD(P)-dependent dehydrogenase (short-subunit alcohol dehydrogenase family)
MSSTTMTAAPVALITGGTTGIGHATARLLREQGFDVLVTGQNPATIAAAQRSLPDGVVVLRADARSLADAEQVAAEIRQRFGRLDVVFLNAGVGRFLSLADADEASFDEHFAINVKGQFFTLQKVLPLLGEGSTVIVTGALGPQKGIPNWSIYSATKGALLAMVGALAVELAPRGIRVNAVTPGPIETPALDKLGGPAESLEHFKETIATRIPLGRLGSDDDVARTVAFLASPAASFITGATILVDGGLAAAL